MAKLDWLDLEHPVYEANKDEWIMNERRLRGGVEVLDVELRKFAYEDEETAVLPEDKAAAAKAFRARVQQAIYPNFPEMLCTSMVGHVMSEHPDVDHALDFGSLGTVARNEGQRDPSLAELMYYNIDGIGNDGSEWPNWWTAVTVRAMGTGFRWVFCDLPVEPSQTLADVYAGARPFLVDLSPLAVTNWDLSYGRLDYAIVRLNERRPRINDKGDFEGNAYERTYLLMTRAGFEGFGPDYSGGGWWKYTADKEPLVDLDGKPLKGNWDVFDGQIPLWPHFYERDQGTSGRPAIARSAITTLGQAAVAYMNMESACEFDAWDSAMSMLFFLGVEPENFNEAVAQAKKGHRWIGMRLTRPDPAVGDLNAPQMEVPLIHDASTGSVPSEVFDSILTRIVENAGKMAAQEATSTPDSSGRSKEAGFSDIKAPRLALIASELQQSQNTAMYFLERAFGKEPEGVVIWTRTFNLLSLKEKVTGIFDLVAQAGIRSARLDARGLAIVAREEGIIADDDEAAEVEEELAASARSRQIAELTLQHGFMAGPAKVAAMMDDLEAMGLFVEVDPMTGDEKDRTVEVSAEAPRPDPITGIVPPQSEAGTRPLREVVQEVLERMAEASDRRAVQQGSMFNLGPFGDFGSGNGGGLDENAEQPTVDTPEDPFGRRDAAAATES